ncbi:MAG: hypothetical protein ACRDJN_28265 [Chloroflexota bacterium]
MTERFVGPLANHFGTYYPTGYVVAVLDSPEQAKQAAHGLNVAGCEADQVRVFTADQVLTINRQFLQARTLPQRIGRLLAADEGEAEQEDLEAAQRGHAFVTVHAPDAAEARRVAAILAQHGGYRIRHYGRAVMTDLFPPRNP